MIVCYVCNKLILAVGVQTGWSERYDEWFPSVQNGGALFIAFLSALWLRRDKDRNEYFISSIAELRKVSWPTVPNTKKMTWIVVVVVSIFSAILTVFDLVWSKTLQWILP